MEGGKKMERREKKAGEKRMKAPRCISLGAGAMHAEWVGVV